ncbi:MAG: hypothetical protein UC771_04995 [Faecalibacterium sp.]|nr:hypothetical protein [Faecalibacterium sp.]
MNTGVPVLLSAKQPQPDFWQADERCGMKTTFEPKTSTERGCAKQTAFCLPQRLQAANYAQNGRGK